MNPYLTFLTDLALAMGRSPLVFAAAVVSAASLTPLVRVAALRLGIVDLPGPRKIHAAPMPLLGGFSMYVAVFLGLFLWGNPYGLPEAIGIIAGASLVFVAGLLDDGGRLHPQVKLLVAQPLAAGLLIASGTQSQVFAATWPVLDYALTLAWVMGITSAFNLLDNMDGLSAGVAAVASLFFVVLGALSQQYLVMLLAAALFGATAGFLIHNFGPARIFMGDGGSLFIGFLLASIGLRLSFPAPMSISWLVPVFVLAIPIFDTSLVTISRLRRGLNPAATPGRDHVSHRLVALGLGPRQAVVLLYALGVLSGLAAVAVGHGPLPAAVAVTLVWMLLAVAAGVWLERAPYDEREVRGSLRVGLRHR